VYITSLEIPARGKVRQTQRTFFGKFNAFPAGIWVSPLAALAPAGGQGSDREASNGCSLGIFIILPGLIAHHREHCGGGAGLAVSINRGRCMEAAIHPCTMPMFAGGGFVPLVAGPEAVLQHLFRWGGRCVKCPDSLPRQRWASARAGGPGPVPHRVS
jgi:hypothetical protein